MDEQFWQALDELIATSKIVIDRPKGSTHPRYPDMIYPLDYGYLANTSAADGGGIDVWCGSEPIQVISSLLCTYDAGKRDMEIKLLLGCTEIEIETIMAFMQTNLISVLRVQR